MKRKQTAIDKLTVASNLYDMGAMKYIHSDAMRLIRAAMREAVRDATECDGSRYRKCEHNYSCDSCLRAEHNTDNFKPKNRGTK